jgi:hypothetical protein
MSMRTPSFHRPALHRAGQNDSTKRTKCPSVNHDALHEALGGRIGTIWKLWEFHETTNILFWTQWSSCQLQVCFHPGVLIFDLEYLRAKPAFVPRDERPPMIVPMCADVGKEWQKQC